MAEMLRQPGSKNLKPPLRPSCSRRYHTFTKGRASIRAPEARSNESLPADFLL